MNTYKLGSLFDGSGGFPLAGSLCGITPVWAAEVEPYPIAVTRSRFPSMKHLGDISKVNGAEIEPVDIITFGSPCQDLSVAGKRAGLKHEANGDEETTRSGLFMEAVRIIKEMREATDGKYPRWALWENVPGAFSSNKGEDFRVVCEELIKIVEPDAVMPGVPKNGWAYADSYCGTGWSLAYRVLDAQYWGVPQRRRRIYLVADFGGECAREVLFECEGLRGYFAEGRTPWQGTSSDVESGTGADDREGNCVGVLASSCKNAEVTDGTICPCLIARAGTGSNQLPLIAVATQQGGAEISENGICPTVTAAAGMSGNNQPYICYGFDGYNSAESGDKAATIGVNCGMSTGRNGVVYGVVTKGNGDAFISEERHTSLCGGGGQAGQGYPCVMTPAAYSLDPVSSNSMKSKNPHSGCRQVEVARTIDTTDPNPSKNQGGIAIVEAFDDYNFQPTGDKTCTLRAGASGGACGVSVCCLEVADKNILDDQGGQQISVREDGKSPTLRAEMHGNIPCVIEAAGFCPEESAKTRGVGYAEEQAPTLRAGAVPGVCIKEQHLFENHSQDTRYRGPLCVCPMLPAQLGTGGNNTPFVVEKDATVAIEGNGCRPSHQGDGYAESDVMYTLNTIDRHAVAYSLETFHCQSEEEKATTLKARDYKDPGVVCYGVDCRNATEYQDSTGALQASAAHNINSNAVVRVRYIVRRLIPTECARLQGFADWWGNIEPKSDFSDEDYLFWLNVRNTHAAINGKAVKDYTKAQMLTWYNKLHTDSAEYKLWGNGIALPTALYVMQGIAERMSKNV